MPRTVVSINGPALTLAAPKHYVRTGSDQGPRAGLPGWLGGDDKLVDRPHTWSKDEAYAHTLVAGNDGGIINRLPHVQNEIAAAQYVCRDQPKVWLGQQPAGQRRIAIYAHGGLNDEAASIDRIRVMAPCFADNDIYPVFYTWKSGWQETIANLLAPQVHSELGAMTPARRLGEAANQAWDRAIEVIARNLLVRSLWSEMKQSVDTAESDGRGFDLLAKQLAGLRDDLSGDLEIHLVGHSAGSLVCGRLLTELRLLGAKVASCTLYAPACDVQFALDHYKAALDKGAFKRENLYLHVLSDAREQEDTVGPYTKSLLYLVSRALESRHKTPLLGLASAFDGACATEEHWHDSMLPALKQWQDYFWNGAVPNGFSESGQPSPSGNLSVLNQKQVSVGPRRIKSAHGCFDYSVDIISATLRTILGPAHDLKKPVKDLDF